MSFTPGLALARDFYRQVVAELIDTPHAACLIGEGSEVLGYDTPRSTDHEWGPRLQVFVPPGEADRVGAAIEAGLPSEFQGYPTAWYSLAQQRVTHHVEISTLRDWLTARVGTDPRDGFDHAAWLAMPQQHLLQLTAGEVFRDDSGELTALRASLQWYPIDVWRWLVASQWHLIANTEPLLGRVREIHDDRGARLLTDRLCHLMMEMAFLQERRYRPYDKWFGTAFGTLDAAITLGPLIDDILSDPTSSAGRALITLAERHNALRITEPVTAAITDFTVHINDALRPYPVLNAQEFINATIEAIEDPALRELVRVGGIDQLTHSDDMMVNFSSWPRELAGLYRALLDS